MKQLVEKLTAVAARVAYVAKNGNNESQGYKYVSVDDVKFAVNAAFRAEGLAVVGTDIMVLSEQAYNKETKTSGRCLLHLEILVSDGTSTITLTGIGEGRDSGDKAPYKAMAGAVKYALTVGLLIASGDQDDPESSDEDGKSTDRPRKPPSAPPATEPTGPTLAERVNRAVLAIKTAPDAAARKKLNAKLISLRDELVEANGNDDMFGPIRAALQEVVTP